MAFPKSRDEEPPKRDDGGWIDVHHHCYQPELIAALRDSGVTQMAPGVLLPEWTAADSLRVMDSTGLSAAVLSVLLPDGNYDTAAAARLANDQSASVVADHPGRFAALGSLPLPDAEASLAELNYALDALSMDGVVRVARYPTGMRQRLGVARCLVADPQLLILDEPTNGDRPGRDRRVPADDPGTGGGGTHRDAVLPPRQKHVRDEAADRQPPSGPGLHRRRGQAMMCTALLAWPTLGVQIRPRRQLLLPGPGSGWRPSAVEW